MRGFIPILLALSASYTTITALPQPRIVHRQAAAKPKYSVVPLEPGDDDPASGDLGGENGNGGSGKGSGGDNGDKDGDGVVTVIRTVTRKPVTKIVTQTEKPNIITVPGKTVTKAVPTTVSVINLGDEPATETVTVSHPSSKPKEPKKPTTTQEPNTPTDEPKPTAQNTPDASSSTAAPGVTSQPGPEPQPKPEPEPSTIAEPALTTESSSTTCLTDSLPPAETVAQPPPTSGNSAEGSNPTTLLTLTSQGAGAPEETAVPAPDSPVVPVPPQETFVDDPTTQGESWSTATVPYVPPVAPTTLITFATTTTSDNENGTPEPTSLSKTQDNGAWHTSYPAWNGTVLAI